MVKEELDESMSDQSEEFNPFSTDNSKGKTDNIYKRCFIITSKHETTNSPICQFTNLNCCIKTKAFKPHF